MVASVRKFQWAFAAAISAQGSNRAKRFSRARTIRDKHGAPFCFFKEGDERPQSTYVWNVNSVWMICVPTTSE
jgi:hypothetical protein